MCKLQSGSFVEGCYTIAAVFKFDAVAGGSSELSGQDLTCSGKIRRNKLFRVATWVSVGEVNA
jgi:hypothetical protein